MSKGPGGAGPRRVLVTRAVGAGLLGLCLLAPAWPALAAAATATSSDVAGLQDQINALNDQLAAQQAQIHAQQASLQHAQGLAIWYEAQKGETQAKLAAEKQTVRNLTAQLQAENAQLVAATAALVAAEQEVSAAQTEADAGLRLVYEGGTVDFYAVLLQSATFTDFLSRFTFLQRIFGAEVAALQRLRAARDAQATETATLEQKRQNLADLQTEANAAVADLRQTANYYSASATLAEAQEQAEANELHQEEAASAQITTMLNSLQIEYKQKTGQLVFAWPLPPPYRITSPFGNRYIQAFHEYDFHTGIDIAEPTGQPIHAAADGVVVLAGWNGGYGNCVIIYHGKIGGKDYYTLYGHQSQIAVKKDQDVSAGQVIGYVGMTGNATGPHLHFEIRVNGTPVNPMPYLDQSHVIKDY